MVVKLVCGDLSREMSRWSHHARRIRVIGEISGFVPFHRIPRPRRIPDGGTVNRRDSGRVVE